MATKTFNITKDATFVKSYGYFNGGDQHHPVGKWDPTTGLDWISRALLYAPVSFTGMTTITEARLHAFKHTSSVHHAKGTGTVTFHIGRVTKSWGESSFGTSGGGENQWGGSGATVMTTEHTNTLDKTYDNSLADGNEDSLDITDIVLDWFNGSPNYGIMLWADDEDNASGALEYYSRESSGFDPYIEITYSTNNPPNAPANLNPSGSEIVNTGTVVTVSGTQSDNDGDKLNRVDIIVYKDDGSTQVLRDTYSPSSPANTFSRKVNVPEGNAFYKWKARTRDTNNDWGPYSSLQRFKANTKPSAPTISLKESPTSDVMTLTPSFILAHNDADPNDDAAAYRIVLQLADGTAVWDSGDITITPASTVTKLYNGPALSWQTAYRWHARTKDENGSWSSYASYSSFTTHATGVPVNLSPSGNDGSDSLTPTFVGTRASSQDSIASYQIILYASDGVTQLWDSGTLTSGITSGTSFSKLYNGTALSNSTTYKWKVRVTGSKGGTSAYSALQTFVTPGASVVTPTAPKGGPITTLTPAFTGTWSGDTLNAIQILLYDVDDNLLRDTGTISVTVGSSYSWTYTGAPALQWATSYKYQIRARRNSDNQWQSYSGKIGFFTDIAGQCVPTAPINDSWETSLTPTFTGNTSNSETISTFRILLYESDGTSLVWDSGDLAGSGTSFSKVYNGPALVRGRTYRWQGRYIKSGGTGATGIYSALQSFHINAEPDGPSIMLPPTGSSVADTLNPSFTASYDDQDLAAWGDFPTNFEVEVYNNSTDALVGTQSLSTGLVAAQNTIVWPQASTTYLIDSFSRTVVDSWGDNSEGTWLLEGPATTFDVNGSVGTMNLNALGATRAGYFLGLGALNSDTVARFQANKMPVGGPITAFVIARSQAQKHKYQTEVQCHPDGHVVVAFAKHLADTTYVSIGTDNTVARETFVDNTWFWIRLQAEGTNPTTLRARVWRDGTVEPTGWDNTVTDSEATLQTGGGTDIRAHLDPGTTNYPILISWDDLVVRSIGTSSLAYETTYKWRARYTDSKSAVGNWSSFATLKLSQGSLVTITSPTADLTTPLVDVTWTFTSPSGKSQASYRITVTDTADDILVHDSGWIVSGATSYSLPGGILSFGHTYEFTVEALDTDGV